VSFSGLIFFPLGEHANELAAVFSATYIGGSANFVAVAEAINFTEPDLVGASLAVDAVFGVVFLTILMIIPASKFITKRFNHSKGDFQDKAVTEYVKDAEKIEKPFSPLNATTAVGLAFCIVTVSDFITQSVNLPTFSLIFSTIIIVTIASLTNGRLDKLTEAFPIGMIFMYLFFAVMGASVDILKMIQSGFVLAGFAATILICHLIFLLSASRFFQLRLPEIIVASNACILGPPTAAAMASANGWNSLITPAILCGTLGYVIANVTGVFLFNFIG